MQTITAMLRNPHSPYLPVALLDDDPAKRNLRVLGLRVAGGREALAEAAAEHHADTVVIAVPSAGSDLLRELCDLTTAADLRILVLPSLGELFGAPIGVGDIRPLTESDLLGRHVIDTDVDAIASYLTGRRVLVTGAGGSIGSELCHQIARFAPGQLVMLDRDESALHGLQLRLEGRALLDDRNLVVADVRDAHRMVEVFAEHRPDVVFHAAALKHLPLLEMHPQEAYKTNVLGTWNVLQAAAGAGVDRFVNISTDKAAAPVSVLGYSKRIAERLTAETATRADGTYLSVRFGNVLGSRGSVLTAFHSQIDAGGPVTVTDPDVTRFFMTVEEAVQLVIQAGAVGRDGEALILDMGDAVRIADVARRLVAQAPRSVPIVYTGLRPGEKLHEVLFGPGEAGRPPRPSARLPRRRTPAGTRSGARSWRRLRRRRGHRRAAGAGPGWRRVPGRRRRPSRPRRPQPDLLARLPVARPLADHRSAAAIQSMVACSPMASSTGSSPGNNARTLAPSAWLSRTSPARLGRCSTASDRPRSSSSRCTTLSRSTRDPKARFTASSAVTRSITVRASTSVTVPT